MTLFEMAVRNISRRKLRTTLTLIGVALGIAAFVTLVGFSNSFEREWLRTLESSATDIAVVQKTFLNTSVDETVGVKLKSLPEVADAAPMVLNLMDLTPEVNAIVYGRPETSFEMESLEMTQGRKFKGEQPEILLGELLAENLGRHIGDKIDIQGQPFQIVGIFRGSAFETGGAVLPMKQLQRLADLGDKVTAFHVKLRPPLPGESAGDHIQRARVAIESACPGLKAVAARDRANNNQIVTLARSIAWGTSLIALLISILGIANTMAISVFERTKDIGVLRALGWKRLRIIRLILMESATLGVVGGAGGLGAGWAVLKVLAFVPPIASIAATSMPMRHASAALGISLLSGVAAGLMPAFHASRLSPVEALRND
jgi:putative ABC transport system permease protein